MLVYVASKFENTKVVKSAYAALRESGHTITHDWTEESAEGLTGEALHVYLEECAKKDMEGVQKCDALLLINHPNGCGMYTELGIALALDKFIVVIDGKNPPHNIFFNLNQVVHAHSLETAVKILNVHAGILKMAKETT